MTKTKTTTLKLTKTTIKRLAIRSGVQAGQALGDTLRDAKTTNQHDSLLQF